MPPSQMTSATSVAYRTTIIPLIIIGGLQDLRIAELDAIAARALEAIARDEPPGAMALTFLLRHYLATDRAELGDALGDALAGAMTRAPAEPSVIGRSDWLILFAETMALSDDERLLATVSALVGTLRDEWPAARQVAEATASVEACLRAADVMDPHDIIPAAIDQLERIVGPAYQPGGGMAGTIDRVAHERGGAADQVRPASALLTAFERTGRLPYSMLAEELIQAACRGPWDDGDLIIHCGAARVLSRLAALHADDQYRGAAVIATDADYRGDASRILQSQSARALDRARSGPDESAAYGLALGEWLAVESAI
jgi:hypothetical protein